MEDSDSISPSQHEATAVPQEAASGKEPPKLPEDIALGSEGNPPPNHAKQTCTCKPDQTPWWKHLLEAIALVAVIFYTRATYKQLDTMNHTYIEMRNQNKVAEQSAYMACLNARAAQATFIQIQRSAIDSHASALATVEQDAANMEAEKAIMSIIARFPAPGDLVNHQLVIPYSIKNVGKSAILSGDMWIKAVLLNDNDALHFNSRNLVSGHGKYMSAGDQYPGNVDPRFHAPTLTVVVLDNADHIVSDTSQDATEFLKGNRGIVFVYGHLTYTDFFGTHRAKFCMSEFVINPGSTHNQTKAERACAAYNHQQDQYTQMPKLEPFPPVDTSRVEAIKCVAPTE